MKIAIRLVFGLSLFLLVAGTVYAVTAQEWQGAVLIIACSAAAVYIALSLRSGERRASHTTDTAEGEEPEVPEEVAQTIWPFVASIAALAAVIGLVASHWVFIVSLILFVATGAGWFADIQRQRVESRHREGELALEGHQQPDDHDRD